MQSRQPTRLNTFSEAFGWWQRGICSTMKQRTTIKKEFTSRINEEGCFRSFGSIHRIVRTIIFMYFEDYQVTVAVGGQNVFD